MKSYDFIMAGGGVAGLSLAYHLVLSPLRERSILIIDRDAKVRNDRTLCFWTEQPTLFDEVVCRSWNRLRFVGETFERVIDLGAYRYKMLRGIDFYRFARQSLSAYPNVEFLQGKIEQIDDGPACASVTASEQVYGGQWVFDSRFRLAQFAPDAARYHCLQQHFKGWEIETTGAAFDPQIPTLFDFRTPQKNEMRFFYVLPLSERRALVEYVLLSHEDTTQALKTYIGYVLGIKDYRVVAEEGGVNPLTDYPFPRQTGQRVMTVGTPGGRVKASSGYAFGRIQQDSAAIVRSLLEAGHPFGIPPDSRFFGLCDSIMLQVMLRHGERLKPIFTTMFQKNSIRRIFRFLDGKAPPLESLALMATMPRRLFLSAWFRTKVLGRI